MKNPKLKTGPVTAATLAVLQQTGNLWLSGVPLDHAVIGAMDTLAWLYIHSEPLSMVELSMRTEGTFFSDVLKFGASVSLSDLDAAGVEILAIVSEMKGAGK